MDATSSLADGRPIDWLIGALVDGRYRVEQRIGEGQMARVYRARHARSAALVRAQGPAARAGARSVDAPPLRSGGRRRQPSRPPQRGRGGRFRRDRQRRAVPGDGFWWAASRSPPSSRARPRSSRTASSGSPARSRAGWSTRTTAAWCTATSSPTTSVLEKAGAGPPVPRILDFGLAIRCEPDGTGSEPRLTEQGFVVGTPIYLSPEQACGEPVATGPPTSTRSASSSTRCWPAFRRSTETRSRWRAASWSSRHHPSRGEARLRTCRRSSRRWCSACSSGSRRTGSPAPPSWSPRSTRSRAPCPARGSPHPSRAPSSCRRRPRIQTPAPPGGGAPRSWPRRCSRRSSSEAASRCAAPAQPARRAATRTRVQPAGSSPRPLRRARCRSPRSPPQHRARRSRGRPARPPSAPHHAPPAVRPRIAPPAALPRSAPDDDRARLAREYREVGEALDRLHEMRGAAVAAPLEARYLRLSYADSLRVASLRREALAQLAGLRRAIDDAE